MGNRWKYLTMGILVIGLTALTSSVLTAYVMRPATGEMEATASEARSRGADHSASTPVMAERRIIPALPSAAGPRVLRVVQAGADETAASAAAVPAPVAAAPAPPVPAPPLPTPPPTPPVVGPSSTASALPSLPTDCATGSDRAWRIAKPGGLGGVVGAVLGAAGGAIADGGNGAGKGALIGAGVGAVAGGAYGAYKTQQECGTILGNSASMPAGSTPPSVASFPSRSEPPQAGLQSSRAAEEITIYDVR